MNLVAALILLLAGSLQEALAIPAFPGAQGGGAIAVGGRGGQVIEVTNLSDSGAGSLRACVLAAGPRICVFRVGGTINLNSGLTVQNPFITIAGHTAPGGGITLRGTSINSGGAVFLISTNNVVLRYIRLRKGFSNGCLGGTCGDNIRMGGGATTAIFDHVSSSFTMDEALDTSNGANTTASYSLLGSCFDRHCTGTISAGNSVANSNSMVNHDMHHNLTMNTSHRNPLYENKSGRIVNSLFYNFKAIATTLSGGGSWDVIGNKYKRGPLGPNQHFEVAIVGQFATPVKQAPGDPSLFMSGNIGWHQASPSGNQQLMAVKQGSQNAPGNQGPLPASWVRATPLPNTAHPIVAEPVSNIENSILPIVGASRRLDCNGNWVLNRDTLDNTLITNYQNTTGISSLPPNESGYGGYPAIPAGTPCADADHDGMPDAWESANGLNPNNASDRNGIQPTGFTNLEAYLAGPQGAPLPGPPSVNVTAPQNSATVTGSAVTVSATAFDDDAVLGVQFKLDGVNLGAEDTSSPYSVVWNTTTASEGPHTLTAVARDAVPNFTTSDPITVTVDNSPAQPPTVSITSPAPGATVSGSVTVSANASDDASVLGVQFKLDGVNLGAEDTTAPYSVSWNTTTTTNVSHTLTAVARDAVPSFTTSSPVTVTVDNGPPSPQSPVVSLTAPSNGSTVSGVAATVSANASDDVAVLGVQFKVDGVNLGAEDTTPPYSVTWNTTTATEGPHALTAVARDAVPNFTTSATVTVTVDNIVGGFKFDIGDRVQVNNGAITVRTMPTEGGSPGTSLGNQPVGVQGTVLAGPITASNGAAYWQINYDTGQDGWSAEQFLDEVGGTVDNPPTVSLTAPANGSTVSGPVTVSANASDPGGSVLGVQFKLDGNNLGAEDTTPPYSVVWNTALATAGSHQLGAVARDSVGATTNATARTVTVNNTDVCP